MPRLLSASFLRRLRQHLRRGGLIAYPTESCFGIGCLPHHQRALKQLMQLKKRPQHKGMIVIGDQLSRLQPLLQPLTIEQQTGLNESWPARKTFLLPAHPNLPAILRGRRRDKLAVRVPDHAGARELCRQLGTALVSTSCNRSGKRPCKSGRDVRRQFGRQLLIIDGRTGQAKSPSQIIDWSSGRQLR